MKELSSTGFMSNRGRQIVCSFLVRDLGIDWRMGAEWFETCLLDYDPCSNYGNWTYGAAGRGIGDPCTIPLYGIGCCRNPGNYEYEKTKGKCKLEEMEIQFYCDLNSLTISKNSMFIAKSYDPEGEYVSYWLPELRALSREKRNFPGQYFYIKPIVQLKYGNNTTTSNSRRKNKLEENKRRTPNR
ncbi:hypothetical protein LguiA_033606 [Lonicera macranthoides]